jgi:hypothetical protein
MEVTSAFATGRTRKSSFWNSAPTYSVSNERFMSFSKRRWD